MAFACTEETIALTEAELERALPEAYRARLKRRNGGAVTDPQGNEWELHPIRDTTERRRLQRTANHIARETTVAKGWRGFPPEGLALGGDGSGNILVMLPRDEHSYEDRLYFFDHETGGLEELGDVASPRD